MKIAIVCGNPKPQSRTLAAAEALARRLEGDGAAYTVELSDIAGELFDYGSASVAEAKKRVLASDLVIVASPTYKASYTGLLKSFLDHFAAGELAGIFAIPFMTIGSDKHYLAAETQLRPVLVELGATVATQSCSITVAQPEDIDSAIAEWATRNWHGIKVFEALSTVEGGSTDA
ncbi:NADPH-dependent FMN reductase [Mycolicibacterium mengxianglii]|uniref:NADPH-dependent FMN reductase n=1 Tax=Mycolicibacterium mengxianglii TaxID=2736649 RepID=UPI0018D12667|nr:NAD(P)H-dependent oxidoreductase [Mycolicibacterium mengxianglii]